MAVIGIVYFPWYSQNFLRLPLPFMTSVQTHLYVHLKPHGLRMSACQNKRAGREKIWLMKPPGMWQILCIEQLRQRDSPHTSMGTSTAGPLNRHDSNRFWIQMGYSGQPVFCVIFLRHFFVVMDVRTLFCQINAKHPCFHSFRSFIHRVCTCSVPGIGPGSRDTATNGNIHMLHSFYTRRRGIQETNKWKTQKAKRKLGSNMGGGCLWWPELGSSLWGPCVETKSWATRKSR